MKKFLILVLVVVGAFLVYKYAFKKDEKPKEKPKPLAVSQHSEGFNQSVDKIMSDYYAMTDGFVNWDAEAVTKSATNLQQSLEQFDVDELKKDSIIHQSALFPWGNARNSVGVIISSPGWPEKRRALQDLSDNIRTLLQTVQYDRSVIYWQECPMAFGEGQVGNWLSEQEAIVNPYLGKKDPKYGASMVSCGETKMKIDFTVADSAAAN